MSSKAGSPAACWGLSPLLVLSHLGAIRMCLSFWYKWSLAWIQLWHLRPQPLSLFPGLDLPKCQPPGWFGCHSPLPTVLSPSSGQEHTHVHTHVHTHSHTHTHSPSDCWANAGQSLSGGSGLGLDIFKGGPTPIQKPSPSSLGSGWWHFLPLSPPLGAQMSSFLSPGPLLLDVFLLRSMGSAPPPHPAVLIPPHPTLAIYRRWVCTETGRQWPLSGHFLGCKQASFLRLLCVPTTLPPAPV